VAREDGFTLLETLAGVSLAAIVAGIGGVRLPALVAGIRTAGAAHDVATTLRLARGRALAAGRPVEVRFDPDARTVPTIGPDGDTLEVRSLAAGVMITGLPADRDITFGGTGGAENGTIALAAGPSVRHVIVNQRGRVRVA
jgi:prepilin-type N-terminal cleavage/methylation domain-containing protein